MSIENVTRWRIGPDDERLSVMRWHLEICDECLSGNMCVVGRHLLGNRPVTPTPKQQDTPEWVTELERKAPGAFATLLLPSSTPDEFNKAFYRAMATLYPEEESTPPAPRQSPLLEALTSATMTDALLGLDPTDPTAGSIYRQDDDPFEGVEGEDGDTGDFDDDDRFVSVWPDTREWLVAVEDLGDE